MSWSWFPASARWNSTMAVYYFFFFWTFLKISVSFRIADSLELEVLTSTCKFRMVFLLHHDWIASRGIFSGNRRRNFLEKRRGKRKKKFPGANFRHGIGVGLESERSAAPTGSLTTWRKWMRLRSSCGGRNLFPEILLFRDLTDLRTRKTSNSGRAPKFWFRV